MRELTSDEFDGCFVHPMRDVTTEAEAGFDIWPYVDAVIFPASGPTKALDVAYVYRDANGSYDQVLIETDWFNVLLVVVIDLQSRSIYGHHLLDLNEKYGLV